MKVIAPQMPCSRQYCSTLRALRAVAHHQQPRRAPSAARARRCATTSSTRLTGRKLEMWTRTLLARLGPAPRAGELPRRLVARRVDEVGHHLDLGSCDAELLDASCLRSDSETAVTASLCVDPPAGGLQVVGVVADQGDVGAVERRHHRQRLRLPGSAGRGPPRPRWGWRSGRAARRAACGAPPRPSWSRAPASRAGTRTADRWGTTTSWKKSPSGVSEAPAARAARS